ncbi:MAG: hypothetical protein Q7K13_05875 [Polynucleobacter sp.]|uniref:hypothetical protein n=1 Tax=Polynucleobacter sp. TaxID=2029855 RepID=UPI00271A67D3|nr:hypothetical protein [Polynucleobacter sp.]MDO8713990.1 hypothetical protein [Polynucleobacter sp.]
MSKIWIRNLITSRDIFDAKDVVYAVPSVIISPHNGAAPNVIAGACIESPIDSSGVCISIVFHQGNKSWSLCREYKSIQKATSYDMDYLPKVVEKFEALIGIKLPIIQVIEHGVGVYPAASHYIDSMPNPWKLVQGEQYEVKLRGEVRQFIVKMNTGSISRIAFISENNPGLHETFDPMQVLTQSAWESLVHSSKVASRSAPKF